MPEIKSEAPSVDQDDLDELMIFPLTDINGDDENDSDLFRNELDDNTEPMTFGGFKPRMTLKQRRRSLLSTGLSIPPLNYNAELWQNVDNNALPQSPVVSPIVRWKKAVRKIRCLKDPWADFHLEELPAENVIRHRYNALKRQWIVDTASVKIEKEPFNHGAMRTCYRLKRLSNTHMGDWSQQSHNYVAKRYMESVSREVYFEDVRLQMDAKLWGEEYNRHRPPKQVDIFQMSVLEFKDRPGSPLFHLEHFIDGHYIKYNSNSGFVEETLRFTPQAFSHFTFECSSHKMIVVDIQGVGDLWTDPQIHTSDGTGYGDGNLGSRGMALFFHSHICNCICESLGLSKFDLAPSEKLNQVDFIKLQTDSVTRLRGLEERYVNDSPKDGFDFLEFFNSRIRTTSNASPALSGISEEAFSNQFSLKSNAEEEPMSVDSSQFSMSPVYRRRSSRFLSESDDSSSSTMTDEEERMRFHLASKMLARPSSVAFEVDRLGLRNVHALGDSILGQIHHDLAIYHEMGRFSGPTQEIDVEAAMYHEQQAAELGIKDAITTLANIYLGIPHDCLSSITVPDSSENRDHGIEYMLMAAHAGDRAAMVFMAKAYETGIGLDGDKSFKNAVEWYEKAANMTQEDECGEFDATMDDPVYQIKASIAQMYMTGGYGLAKDPSCAGDLFTEAAEGATAAMKGRLANKYFALAEEAWAMVEDAEE